ncbi:MAG TPA: response regulator [Chthoniobacterales bacterium]|nr:response regulator [Chthoniobacterales bacterium]
MKAQNDDRLRQELRLAQLEIKVLREQLLKSVQEAQRAREEMEARAEAEVPETAEPRVVLPMTPNGADAPADPVVSHSNGGRPRVLYVEDSEPNYRLVENVLRERPGTDLLWAETGQQALEMARTNAPKLVLLDLDLPDMHGSKVLENLQAQPGTQHTPVIVISADATPSQIERMLAAGARNYLTKPFDIRRFLCMFDEVITAA